MKYFIVQETSDYADEFDIEGFKLYQGDSEKEIQLKVLDQFKNYEGIIEYPLNLYFGTNECQTYKTLEDLLKDLTFSTNECQTYKTLEDLLKDLTFS